MQTRVLPVIVISQFFCTSLWFAGNAIMPDIIGTLDLNASFLAHLTTAVQLGFTIGTLIFALVALVDRYSPSLIFLCSAVIAALFNLGVSIDGINAPGLLALRFGTGFFLAGIYPVGMKIASDYFQKGLGKSLGFLVGALVVGTALPHLLRGITTGLPWRHVIFTTSGLAATGGLAMFLLVRDGPFRKPGQQLQFNAFLSGFSNKHFRSAAIGYFGHMWEVYAFWAFVPIMLIDYHMAFAESDVSESLWSFIVIASGGFACVISGLLSQKLNSKTIATVALLASCLCCIFSPFILKQPSFWLVHGFLIFWGMVVAADSPLFSALVAKHAKEELRGTSLTIVNCIGFAITIVSIQFVQKMMISFNGSWVYTLFAIGPIAGLIALLSDKEEKNAG